MAKKKEQSPSPVVRVAPLGELNAYTVSEHELDKLGSGSSVSDLLTIGYCLVSVAATILVTILSTTVPQLNFILFFCSLLICAIGGVICLVLGWKRRVSTTTLVAAIKNRMPPQQPIEQLEPAAADPPSAPSTDGGRANNS